ncbi:ABC transporter ATP-binding protein [Cupriavidus malaysiensis]|uniref:ABC transporter ATP-binding protein n=1 Tax=Cupriavidus malaysiensis TaxID=367825 RepID=A0ABM7D8F9_9BURK|nr:ABC transporter ATP-binding protein [Cupriavidus malaysiensis]AOZ10155.1 ABC transporter ATP-binding protein [Cupriavidus malaysiensis]
MNPQAILSLRGLRKSFGDVDIIRGVDLEVRAGERHALIGPNGAGKSTLFHLISGRLPASGGQVLLDGAAIQGLSPQEINRRGLARSFQITNIFAGLSVFENVRLAVMRRHGLQYVLWRFANRLRAVRDETMQLLDQVRLGARAGTVAGELSYSEQRSLEIAMTLASDPKVIMLDEPMAGMSQEETDYTAGLIRELSRGRTLMIVEHDMDVVFSLSDRISVLVYGEIVATGSPEEIRNNPRVKEAYLGEEAAA